MASGNFNPEIRAAMAEKSKGKPPPAGRKPDPGETPADAARDKKQGIQEGSQQDAAMDAQSGPQSGPKIGVSHPPAPGSVAHNNTLNPAHAAIAASIAHAILGKGGM
jgi:hypothetical protein